MSVGYSGTPLVRKLGIKPGARVGVLGEPSGFRATLGALPEGVAVRRQARGPLDVAVAFFTRRAELERRLPALRRALDPAGGLWIAWPKRASGVETDLSDKVVRELAMGRTAGEVSWAWSAPALGHTTGLIATTVRLAVRRDESRVRR